MEKLLERAARIVAARAERVAERLAEAAPAELPRDVAVRREEGGLVVEGRALARRALSEAALRGLAALAKALLK